MTYFPRTPRFVLGTLFIIFGLVILVFMSFLAVSLNLSQLLWVTVTFGTVDVLFGLLLLYSCERVIVIHK